MPESSKKRVLEVESEIESGVKRSKIVPKSSIPAGGSEETSLKKDIRLAGYPTLSPPSQELANVCVDLIKVQYVRPDWPGLYSIGNIVVL